MGILVGAWSAPRERELSDVVAYIKTLQLNGIRRAAKSDVHATFFQKVILCAVAGFLAASVLQWAKVFVEGADDALNKGYKHRSVLDLNH